MNDIKHIRYIVFLILDHVQKYLSGQRVEALDGAVFRDLKDARDYARLCIREKICTRFVIGWFVWEERAEYMNIKCVETFGFKNDRKNLVSKTTGRILNSWNYFRIINHFKKYERRKI